MPPLPRITGRKLLNCLQTFGFKIVRSKGSHFFMKHNDGRCCVVPVHSGETIGPGLLTRLLKDCDISKEELKEKL